MPGRDITRPQNRATKPLFIFTCVIAMALCASQSGAQFTENQNAPKPDSSSPNNLAQSSSPAPQSPATQNPPAAPQTSTSQTQEDREKGLSDQGVFVFKKDVDEVLLHATVQDDKSHIITNLDKNAFTVFEDGKPQTIISFHNQDIPVSMGIVIDNSGSMREKRAKVNQAVLNLVRASNPRDEVFIVNFNDEYYLDQDFTNDLLKMKDALEKIDARGGTALRDAVVASAEHLKMFGRLEKKVLFVVTDGDDNASNETLEQAVKDLSGENGPQVYAIGILGDEEHPKRARKALEIMAERTGGIAFFPKTLDEVDEISKAVAHDIRNQYLIGYKPTNPRSAGGFRQVRVEAKAKGHGKMIVRTKSGYYAGAQTAGSASK
jgi:Ca-activated chloride channel homolog